jgi:hypothetical protein
VVKALVRGGARGGARSPARRGPACLPDRPHTLLQACFTICLAVCLVLGRAWTSHVPTIARRGNAHRSSRALPIPEHFLIYRCSFCETYNQLSKLLRWCMTGLYKG